jgi:hypothetical protein
MITYRSCLGSAVLLFSAAAFAMWAAMGTQMRGATSSPILYIVDSTGDGDLVGPNTSCDDGMGHCTLRAAIEASNSHVGTDTIVFDIPTTDPGYHNGTWTINVSKALPNISDAVAINGPGAKKLQLFTQFPGFRAFTMTTTEVVTLSGLTVRNFDVSDFGGAVYNATTGTVNISNCTLAGNTTFLGGSGGAVYNASTGTVNIATSSLSGNSATNAGGAIYNSGGTIKVTNCTLKDNVALLNNNDQNGFGGAICARTGTLTVINTAINNNYAVNGGGIYTSGAIVNITNPTFSANFANAGESTEGGGGGIYIDIGGGTVNVTNSTLTGNSAFAPFAVGGGRNFRSRRHIGSHKQHD